MVNVNKQANPKVPESELQVKVPGCSYFKKKVNVTAIDCERFWNEAFYDNNLGYVDKVIIFGKN